VPGIEPVAINPTVTRQWNQEVADGTRPAYGLLCFSTQDRLSYQQWIDSLLAHIASLNEIIATYEKQRRGG
jgi:hypothetical protein